jgi:hypothetical protein
LKKDNKNDRQSWSDYDRRAAGPGVTLLQFVPDETADGSTLKLNAEGSKRIQNQPQGG